MPTVSELYFPRAKMLLTPEKTMISENDQFHVPFISKLLKVAIVTLFLMISSAVIIPVLYYYLSASPQLASSVSENSVN